MEAGDIVELDPDKPKHYRKARGQSQLIAGIITTKPGFTLGNEVIKKASPKVAERANKDLEEVALYQPKLALLGRVPVKATTENGPIRLGDLLTVSTKPGYAMRCGQAKECEGMVVGKALETLESGEGLILVLVMH